MNTEGLKKKMTQAFGSGMATADLSGLRLPSPSDPTVPEEGIPGHQYAGDIETYCKTNKCSFIGQDEADPSFLVFEADGKRFKVRADTFRSGFRGVHEEEK